MKEDYLYDLLSTKKSHRCILSFYSKINIKDKSAYFFARVQTSMRIEFQSVYENLSVYEGMSFHTISTNNEQDETDQGTFREENFN